MKFCVFGAGAIGGLFGAKLALAGHEVSFVARGEHLAAMRKNGVTLNSAGQTHTVRATSTDDPREIGPQDYVLLTLKAPSVPAAAAKIRPLLGPQTAIVTAMNGMPYWYFYNLPGPWKDRRLTSIDPDGATWDNLPPARAIGCVIHAAGHVAAPGVITHASGKRLIVGEPDGSDSDRVRRLGAALTASGFDATVTPRIRQEIWLKLWGNASFNPVSVLTHGTLEALASDPDSRSVLGPMMTELQEIARRLDITFPIDVERRMDIAKELGPHKTSMLQDLERGRPMEIDGLLGSVVEMARMVGVETPICGMILALVRQRARMAGLL